MLGQRDELISFVTTNIELIQKLKTDLVKAEGKAKLYDDLIASRREDVKVLLAKARPDKNNAGTERVIEQMNREGLDELSTELSEEIASAFPLTCQSCGEPNLQRRSSKEEPGVQTKTDGTFVDAGQFKS